MSNKISAGFNSHVHKKKFRGDGVTSLRSVTPVLIEGGYFMINRFFIIMAIILLITGCGQAKRSPVAIEIDGIKLTKSEFEEFFKNSFYAREDSPESRKVFLDNLVTRKLILKEAEREKLHIEPEFLKDVEFFWEQSLLKSMLDRKTRELSLGLRVSDMEIKDFYQRHKDTEFKDKELPEVYNEIQWLLLRERQQNAITEWIDSLKEKSKLKINYKLLEIKEK